jgi:hypothetical protein
MELNKLINIVLIAFAVVLFINLFQPPATYSTFEMVYGSIFYYADSSEPKCFFNNSVELSEIPIDMCCYEIQQQLTCKSIATTGLSFKCYISETSGKYYLINQKTLNYCKKEGYDVKTE